MDKRRNFLSDDEQRRLQAIEAALSRDDPDLVASFETGGSGGHRTGSVVGAVSGSIVLALGLLLASPILGLIGFSVTVLATSRLLADQGVVDRLRRLTGQLSGNADKSA